MTTEENQKLENKKNYILSLLEETIEVLENMSSTSAKLRQPQLDKMRSLRNLLLDKNKRIEMEGLRKCESVLANLSVKMKQSNIQQGSKPETESTFQNTTYSEEENHLEIARERLNNIATKRSENKKDASKNANKSDVYERHSNDSYLFRRRPYYTETKQTNKSCAKKSTRHDYSKDQISPELESRRWEREGTETEESLFRRRSPSRLNKKTSLSYHTKKRKKSKKCEDETEEYLTPYKNRDTIKKITNFIDKDVDIVTLTKVKQIILNELKHTETVCDDESSGLKLKENKQMNLILDANWSKKSDAKESVIEINNDSSMLQASNNDTTVELQEKAPETSSNKPSIAEELIKEKLGSEDGKLESCELNIQPKKKSEFTNELSNSANLCASLRDCNSSGETTSKIEKNANTTIDITVTSTAYKLESCKFNEIKSDFKKASESHENEDNGENISDIAAFLESTSNESKDKVEIPFFNEPTVKQKESVLSEIEILQALKNDILNESLNIPTVDTETPALHQPKVTKVANVQEIAGKRRISIENYKIKSKTEPKAKTPLFPLATPCSNNIRNPSEKPSAKLTDGDYGRLSPKFSSDEKGLSDEDIEETVSYKSTSTINITAIKVPVDHRLPRVLPIKTDVDTRTQIFENSTHISMYKESPLDVSKNNLFNSTLPNDTGDKNKVSNAINPEVLPPIHAPPELSVLTQENLLTPNVMSILMSNTNLLQKLKYQKQQSRDSFNPENNNRPFNKYGMDSFRKLECPESLLHPPILADSQLTSSCSLGGLDASISHPSDSSIPIASTTVCHQLSSSDIQRRFCQPTGPDFPLTLADFTPGYSLGRTDNQTAMGVRSDHDNQMHYNRLDSSHMRRIKQLDYRDRNREQIRRDKRNKFPYHRRNSRQFDNRDRRLPRVSSTNPAHSQEFEKNISYSSERRSSVSRTGKLSRRRRSVTRSIPTNEKIRRPSRSPSDRNNYPSDEFYFKTRSNKPHTYHSTSTNASHKFRARSRSKDSSRNFDARRRRASSAGISLCRESSVGKALCRGKSVGRSPNRENSSGRSLQHKENAINDKENGFVDDNRNKFRRAASTGRELVISKRKSNFKDIKADFEILKSKYNSVSRKTDESYISRNIKDKYSTARTSEFPIKKCSDITSGKDINMDSKNTKQNTKGREQIKVGTDYQNITIDTVLGSIHDVKNYKIPKIKQVEENNNSDTDEVNKSRKEVNIKTVNEQDDKIVKLNKKKHNTHIDKKKSKFYVIGSFVKNKKRLKSACQLSKTIKNKNVKKVKKFKKMIIHSDSDTENHEENKKQLKNTCQLSKTIKNKNVKKVKKFKKMIIRSDSDTENPEENHEEKSGLPSNALCDQNEVTSPSNEEPQSKKTEQGMLDENFTPDSTTDIELSYSRNELGLADSTDDMPNKELSTSNIELVQFLTSCGSLLSLLQDKSKLKDILAMFKDQSYEIVKVKNMLGNLSAIVSDERNTNGETYSKEEEKLKSQSDPKNKATANNTKNSHGNLQHTSVSETLENSSHETKEIENKNVKIVEVNKEDTKNNFVQDIILPSKKGALNKGEKNEKSKSYFKRKSTLQLKEVTVGITNMEILSLQKNDNIDTSMISEETDRKESKLVDNKNENVATCQNSLQDLIPKETEYPTNEIIINISTEQLRFEAKQTPPPTSNIKGKPPTGNAASQYKPGPKSKTKVQTPEDKHTITFQNISNVNSNGTVSSSSDSMVECKKKENNRTTALMQSEVISNIKETINKNENVETQNSLSDLVSEENAEPERNNEKSLNTFSEKPRSEPKKTPLSSTDPESNLPTVNATGKYRPGPKSKTKIQKTRDEHTVISQRNSDGENLISSVHFSSDNTDALVESKKAGKRKTCTLQTEVKSKNKRKETKFKTSENTVKDAKISEKAYDTDCFTDKTYCFGKNIFTYKCRLCEYDGEDIVNHYKKQHPHSEIPLSRLSIDMAKATIVECEKINLKLISKLPAEKYTCRFCLKEFPRDARKQQTLTTFFWHVVKMHTGEYEQLCSLCVNTKRCPNKLDTPPPPKNVEQLIGYICSKCNFTQISLNNLKTHIYLRHNDEQTEVFTIILSLITKKTSSELSKNISSDVAMKKQDKDLTLKSSLLNQDRNEASYDNSDVLDKPMTKNVENKKELNTNHYSSNTAIENDVINGDGLNISQCSQVQEERVDDQNNNLATGSHKRKPPTSNATKYKPGPKSKTKVQTPEDTHTFQYISNVNSNGTVNSTSDSMVEFNNKENDRTTLVQSEVISNKKVTINKNDNVEIQNSSSNLGAKENAESELNTNHYLSNTATENDDKQGASINTSQCSQVKEKGVDDQINYLATSLIEESQNEPTVTKRDKNRTAESASGNASKHVNDYPHFKIQRTEAGTTEYVCCINGKDNHYKSSLLISMKKHVQTKHTEIWEGYCHLCKNNVTPQGDNTFKDCLQHYLDKHNIDEFPILETLPTGKVTTQQAVQGNPSPQPKTYEVPTLGTLPVTQQAVQGNPSPQPKTYEVPTLGTLPATQQAVQGNPSPQPKTYEVPTLGTLPVTQQAVQGNPSPQPKTYEVPTLGTLPATQQAVQGNPSPQPKTYEVPTLGTLPATQQAVQGNPSPQPKTYEVPTLGTLPATQQAVQGNPSPQPKTYEVPTLGTLPVTQQAVQGNPSPQPKTYEVPILETLAVTQQAVHGNPSTQPKTYINVRPMSELISKEATSFFAQQSSNIVPVSTHVTLEQRGMAHLTGVHQRMPATTFTPMLATHPPLTPREYYNCPPSFQSRAYYGAENIPRLPQQQRNPYKALPSYCQHNPSQPAALMQHMNTQRSECNMSQWNIHGTMETRHHYSQQRSIEDIPAESMPMAAAPTIQNPAKEMQESNEQEKQINSSAQIIQMNTTNEPLPSASIPGVNSSSVQLSTVSISPRSMTSSTKLQPNNPLNSTTTTFINSSQNIACEIELSKFNLKDQLFQCAKCSTVLKTKNGFKMHARKCFEDCTISCAHCNVTIANIDALVYHFLQDHPSKTKLVTQKRKLPLSSLQPPVKNKRSELSMNLAIDNPAQRSLFAYNTQNRQNPIQPHAQQQPVISKHNDTQEQDLYISNPAAISPNGEFMVARQQASAVSPLANAPSASIQERPRRVTEHATMMQQTPTQIKCAHCSFQTSTIENITKHQVNTHYGRPGDIFYFYCKGGSNEDGGSTAWIKQVHKVGVVEPERRIAEPLSSSQLAFYLTTEMSRRNIPETPQKVPNQPFETSGSLELPTFLSTSQSPENASEITKNPRQLLAPSQRPVTNPKPPSLDLSINENIDGQITEYSIEDLCNIYGQFCEPQGMCYACPFCKRFLVGSEEAMRSHLCEELRWVCPYCPYKAFSDSNIDKHLLSEHMVSGRQHLNIHIQKWMTALLQYQTKAIEKKYKEQQKIMTEKQIAPSTTTNANVPGETFEMAFDVLLFCPKCSYRSKDTAAMKFHLERHGVAT